MTRQEFAWWVADQLNRIQAEEMRRDLRGENAPSPEERRRQKLEKLLEKLLGPPKRGRGRPPKAFNPYREAIREFALIRPLISERGDASRALEAIAGLWEVDFFTLANRLKKRPAKREAPPK